MRQAFSALASFCLRVSDLALGSTDRSSGVGGAPPAPEKENESGVEFDARRRRRVLARFNLPSQAVGDADSERILRSRARHVDVDQTGILRDEARAGREEDVVAIEDSRPRIPSPASRCRLISG